MVLKDRLMKWCYYIVKNIGRMADGNIRMGYELLGVH